MARCFLGIGSNLGEPHKLVSDAIRRLANSPGITLRSCSRLYRTEPVGIASRNWFINAVCEIETDLAPRELLKLCLGIEKEFGRDRALGPDRQIDLDILYFNNCIIWEQDLKIPHPSIAQRGFVLIPWSDISPGLILRPWNESIRAMLDKVEKDGVEEWG